MDSAACPRLTALIRETRAEIVDRFTREIQRRGLPPGPLPRPVIIDHLDELLDELMESVAPRPKALETARAHAKSRWETGFELESLVREYGVLRGIISDLARERGAAVPAEEWNALDATLWASVVLAIGAYTRFRDEREAMHKRALEVARAELEGFCTAAPLGFTLLDRDLRFRIVNPALAELNGAPIEAHIGKTPMELLPEMPAAYIVESAKRVLETGEALKNVPIEASTLATPGQPRHFVAQWFPVRAFDEIVGVGVIVEDVTVRRRIEASRDRVIGIVSHDLRNPLQAILAACALLFARGPRPEIARPASLIQRSAARMRAIVEHLFDYARLDETGRLPLDRRRLDLGELTQRVVEEAELASQPPEVALRVETSGDLSGEWDEARLEQVVANLVGNALQHGDHEVRIRARGGRDDVTLEVENAGPPIPPEVRDRIFQPFNGAARGGRHLGLGLYITREIVRAHGGEISVRSCEGATIFLVRLPRRPC